MKITLTDISIAVIILQNISKAESGDGMLIIELPQNITLTIDYSGNNLESRCIQIDINGHCIKRWKGGEIAPDEIEKCLKNRVN